MNFPFLAAMLTPSAGRAAVAPEPTAPSVLQAIRAVGDYAEALSTGQPIDEAALAYARCVLEHGRRCDERDVSAVTLYKGS